MLFSENLNLFINHSART